MVQRARYSWAMYARTRPKGRGHWTAHPSLGIAGMVLLAAAASTTQAAPRVAAKPAIADGKAGGTKATAPCDADAPSASAYARCARREQAAARRALMAARAQCRTSGPALMALVAHGFDAAGLGRREIDGWNHLDDGQRRAFVELAEQALGPPRRAALAATICSKPRVDEVRYFPEGYVRVTLSARGDEGDPLAKVRIELERDPDQQWRYAGTFDYGVTVSRPPGERLGGGDYDRALAELAAANATPP